MTLANIWNTAWPILVAILIFGLIVFVHEFGHFIFAKLFKIRVNEFSIGFGPAIFNFTRGETKYALRILPFGGFCAMEGETEKSEDAHAFTNAKIWQRIIVVAAGAVFNLILGVIIMMTATCFSDLIATNQVAKFAETAVSNQGESALMVKDEIRKVNGRSIFCSDDIPYMLSSDEDGLIDFEVVRDGKKVQLDGVKFNMQEYEGHRFVSLDFSVYGEKKSVIGVMKYGFLRTVSMGRLVWMSLGDLIRGRYGINDISGPVGVAQVMSNAVSTISVDGIQGLLYLMKILCLITVNLGIFNLLPIPALDGSRIWFLAIEGIRGKPVKNEALVHSIGLAILLALMVLLVFKDLWVWIF